MSESDKIMNSDQNVEISSLETNGAIARQLAASSNQSPSMKPINHFRALADAVLATEEENFGLTEEEQRQIDSVLEETGHATERFGVGAIEVYAFKNPRLVPVGFWVSNAILENPELTESDVPLLMEPQVSFPNTDLVGQLWSNDVHRAGQTTDKAEGRTNIRFSSLSKVRRRRGGDHVNEMTEPEEVPGSIKSAPGRVRGNFPPDVQRPNKRPSPQQPRDMQRQVRRERDQKQGLMWRELLSVIQDPDQSHGPRTEALHKAGLDKATGIPFNVGGTQGMIVYYARAGMDSLITTNPLHEAYLKRATQVKGAVLAAIAAKRLLDTTRVGVPETPASLNTMATEATTAQSQPNSQRRSCCRRHFVAWLKKIRGGGAQTPPCISWSEAAWTFVGSFIALVILSVINEAAQLLSDEEYFLVAGPLGALVMLQYGLVGAPASQPRSIIYGHIVAGTISLALTYIPEHIVPVWVRLILSPSLSIAFMMKLGVPCPPASAISVIYAEGKHNWNFFALTLAADVVAIVIAIAFNNLNPKRQYPTFWRFLPTRLLHRLTKTRTKGKRNDAEMA